MVIQQTIEDLVTLVGVTPQDGATLKSVAPQTQQWADDFVAVFYDALFAYRPSARIFKDGERADREKTLRWWYLQIIGGEFDDNFWQYQWVVGIRHIARGITNAFMLGIMSRMQLFFMEKCFQTFEPAQAQTVFAAFKRITDVVAGLIAEGYHITYVEATENVGTLLRSIIERKLRAEVEQKVSEVYAMGQTKQKGNYVR
jgi:hypothetical protein